MNQFLQEKEEFLEEKIQFIDDIGDLFSFIELRKQKTCWVVDQNIAKIHDFSKHPFVFQVIAEEKRKNMQQVHEIHEFLFKNHFCRRDLVVAVGGGITTDMVAFAASMYMRGITYILIPTTLLAMVDACYGGKTGVNNDYGKNQIGTFSEPDQILILIGFSCFLIKRLHLFVGQEVGIKWNGRIHQMCSNSRQRFFRLSKVLRYWDSLQQEQQEMNEILENIVRQSLRVKISIVKLDKNESNRREVLNFGHTYGHAVEYAAKVLNYYVFKYTLESININNITHSISYNILLPPLSINAYHLKIAKYLQQPFVYFKSYLQDQLLHGECVSIGIVLISELALLSVEILRMQDKTIKHDEIKQYSQQLVDLLIQYELPSIIPEYIDRAQILKYIQYDKKQKNTKLRFVFLRSIGNVFEVGIPIDLQHYQIPLLKQIEISGPTGNNFSIENSLIPGSKSITNRVLLMAALGKGLIKINRMNFCDDTQAMFQCLNQLGYMNVVERRYDYIILDGSKGISSNKSQTFDLFVNDSGTTARFIIPLVLFSRGEYRITGNKSICERPIHQILDALGLIPYTKFMQKENHIPFIIQSDGVFEGGSILIDSQVTSQFISSILMVSPYALNEVTLTISHNENQQKLVSEPFIMMTIALMSRFGIEVKRISTNVFVIPRGVYVNPPEFSIEPDATAATYDMAIVALNGGSTLIRDLNENSLQGDYRFAYALTQIGLRVEQSQLGLQIIHSNDLQPITYDCSDITDTFITLAVILSAIEGISILTGIANQRVKECNRIKAVVRNLNKCGIVCCEVSDGLRIGGRQTLPSNLRRKIIVKTYNDHRIAMAFGVLASHYAKVGNGIQIVIDNKDCVQKTFPNYWKHMQSYGIQVQSYVWSEQQHFIETYSYKKQNIIFIGMRGCGKTSISKEVSKRLQWKYIGIDDEIEQFLGKSIKDVVEEQGWQYFRTVEKQILFQIIRDHEHCIIDCGGGVLENDESFSLLQSQSNVIFIEKCIEDILESQSELRPQFSQSVQDIYAQRKQRYLKASKYILPIPQMKKMMVDSSNLDQSRYYAKVLKLAYKFCKSILNLNFPMLPIYSTPSSFACIFLDDINSLSSDDFDCISRGYNSLEIRLDKYMNVNKPIDEVCEAVRQQVGRVRFWIKVPLILTIRSISEGGFLLVQPQLNSKSHIVVLLKSLIKTCRDDFFDIELGWCGSGVINDYIRRYDVRVILSKHFIPSHKSQTVQNIIDHIDSMKSQSFQPQLLKIVVHEQCLNPKDVFQRINVPEHFGNTPYLVISMGDNSKPYRALQDYMVPLAYGNNTTAPGQMTLSDWSHPMVKQFYLFGTDITKSCSDLMHQHMFNVLNSHHSKQYAKQQVKSIEEVRAFVSQGNFQGASVTMPFKQEVGALVTWTSVEVDLMGGSINTIVKYNKKILGFNTDWWGIYYPLLKVMGSAKSCLVLGYGGTAYTAAFVVTKLLGMNVSVGGRNIDKAQAMVNRLSNAVVWDQSRSQFDLVVSCVPGGIVLNNEVLIHKPLVFICSYEKGKGELQRACEASGCTVINGKEMLIYQALGQAQIFNGKCLTEVHKLKMIQPYLF